MTPQMFGPDVKPTARMRICYSAFLVMSPLQREEVLMANGFKRYSLIDVMWTGGDEIELLGYDAGIFMVMGKATEWRVFTN